MKNIILNERQYKLLKEVSELERNISSLPDFLLGDIDKGNTPLSFAVHSKSAISKLVTMGFEDAKSCFSDDITKHSNEEIVNKLNKLVRICQKKEEKIREQLEKICSDLVTSSFDLNGKDYQLDCTLVDTIPPTQDFHIYSNLGEEEEYDSINDISDTEKEENKRKYINLLVIGSAMNLGEELLKKSLSSIFELDEELPHLYSKIVKINNYLLYTQNNRITDGNHMQGAYEKVTASKDNNIVRIESKGIIFPFLLIETVRGFMETMSAQVLPYEQDRAEKILDKCDKLEDEPWYMRLGLPFIKNRLGGNVSLKEYEGFLQKILEMPSEEFTSLMNEVLVGTRAGREAIEDIINDLKYRNDYSDFEKDLQKKRDEKGLIVDDYYTAEELDNEMLDEYFSNGELNENEVDEANYPENFDMETFKNITSFNGRVRYCNEHLQRLGSGSSRIAYLIDDSTVLKLAKNQKGIAQNEQEGRPDWYRKKIGIFAEVYDVDENYLWIEMELARRAKTSDFKRIENIPFNMVVYWIYRVAYDRGLIQYKYTSKYDRQFNDSEFIDWIYDSGSILYSIEDFIGNYGKNSGFGDLARVSSWGVARDKDGNEHLVIIDYGLTDDVYEKYYK